jgi:hypothetical protein
MPINIFWGCRDATVWDAALERYWSFVRPENMALERSLNELSLERLARLDGNGWYSFLRNEYFRWKYTAPNRYATTTGHLRRYLEDGTLDELHQICQLLLSPPEDIHSALKTARAIHGLGPAGASGLLALMHPSRFGTVDQFVVSALQDIEALPQAALLKQMKKPDSLNISNAATVVEILRQKAADNNDVFRSNSWTPRKVDMVLWAFRSRSSSR